MSERDTKELRENLLDISKHLKDVAEICENLSMFVTVLDREEDEYK